MDDRAAPEDRSGAEPADGAAPAHSHGRAMDDPQPSAQRKPDPVADGAPKPRSATHQRRALIEALLEGVPLPATKSDLEKHARRYGGAEIAADLKPLAQRRYSSIDEVGEALDPVQPSWSTPRRVPRPESDLPPGGPAYGA